MQNRLSVAALILILASCQPSYAASKADICAAITAHDEHFQAAAKRYMTGYHWHWLKAQSCQESLIKATAKSQVGAYGFMQFMPATWRDMQKQLKVPPLLQASARDQIDAGAFYMGQLTASWAAKRTANDRLKLALASYNAGIGNLLKAQKKCDGCSDYAGIIRQLPAVTGDKNSRETIGYSINIFGIFEIWRGDASKTANH